jgi:hypothetical protein
LCPDQDLPEKVVSLTEEELKQYGNRCPTGYSKVKLLGK